MKKVKSFALACFTAALTGASVYADDGGKATAEIMDVSGKRVGNAVFVETDKGVEVTVSLNGFKPSPAGTSHGLHIHQVGKCQPTFEAAGDHFSPLDHSHGYLRPDGTHAGDLPNIWIEANGSTNYEFTTDLFTLEKGDLAILDDDGAAIMIHAEPDDYLTGSSGSSGDRIACGVINPASV